MLADGQTGQTDGEREGRTDGRTDRQTDRYNIGDESMLSAGLHFHQFS